MFIDADALEHRFPINFFNFVFCSDDLFIGVMSDGSEIMINNHGLNIQQYNCISVNNLIQYSIAVVYGEKNKQVF